MNLLLAMSESASILQLIITSIIGVCLILFLIIVMKLHAFVTLLLVSFLVGIGSGMPLFSTKDTQIIINDFIPQQYEDSMESELLKNRNKQIKEHFTEIYFKSSSTTSETKPEPIYLDLYDSTVTKSYEILDVDDESLLILTQNRQGYLVEKKVNFNQLKSASGLVEFTKRGIIDTVKEGMGGLLGFVAIIVGLGAMFGKILEVSGGAERLGRYILNKVGDKNAPWALGLIGFIISIPVFLDVGLILMMPIIYSLATKTGKPILFYGVPLLAGLAVTHGMIPPTPGPIAVADLLGANLGWVILFGGIAGVPAMILGGPVFGKYISQKIPVGIPDFMDDYEVDESKKLPSFSLVLVLILTPLVLMLLGSLIEYTSLHINVKTTLRFLGNPLVAMLIATLLAFYTLGKFCGYSREEVQEIATKSLEPVGIILLVTGAGGVFKQVLIDSGVGQVIGQLMKDSSMPPILLAFVISALVRVAQGSATVAMVTAGGIMSGIISGAGMTISSPSLALITIAIACGATVLGHVNDSAFWLVSRFFGLSVRDTLKSWTVLVSIIGFVGFGVVFMISLFVE
ncbi:MAG: GntP family permease [Lentisphaeraceae bacterium]|nr:GntP family permease [Lentisphaeraceae bacterium]